MDPNGGNNPSAPRLDNQQGPTDIFQQPQSFDQPVTTASIPPEVPTNFDPTPVQDGFAAPPQPPQFTDPMAGYAPQQPAAMDPMMSQPTMDTSMAAPVAAKSKKPLLMIIGALLGIGVLAGVGYGGYSMGYGAGQRAAQAEFQNQQAALQQQATDEAPAEDVQLDLTELSPFDAASITEENLEGGVGEQLNASDGFVMYVTNIERGFSPEDPSYQLDEGKELVKVNFLMGNKTEDKAIDIKSSNLYLLEGDSGTKIVPESRLADYEGKFDLVKIEPGQQVQQSVVFEVTTGSSPLVIVREQPYRVTQGGSEKIVTTKTSIRVAE